MAGIALAFALVDAPDPVENEAGLIELRYRNRVGLVGALVAGGQPLLGTALLPAGLLESVPGR